MFNFVINPINSPCKDCKNRCVGCHTSENCNKWEEYQKVKAQYDKQHLIEKEIESLKAQGIYKRMHGKNYNLPSEKEF